MLPRGASGVLQGARLRVDVLQEETARDLMAQPTLASAAVDDGAHGCELDAKSGAGPRAAASEQGDLLSAGATLVCARNDLPQLAQLRRPGRGRLAMQA